VPETLVYCWGVVTDETPLAGSELDVTHIPAVISCGDCGATTTLHGIPMLVCGTCGGGTVTVISGEEFLVRSMDVKD
jgi:hydrogenase nickel incorporation protein HypA/HybF